MSKHKCALIYNTDTSVGPLEEKVPVVLLLKVYGLSLPGKQWLVRQYHACTPRIEFVQTRARSRVGSSSAKARTCGFSGWAPLHNCPALHKYPNCATKVQHKLRHRRAGSFLGSHLGIMHQHKLCQDARTHNTQRAEILHEEKVESAFDNKVSRMRHASRQR